MSPRNRFVLVCERIVLGFLVYAVCCVGGCSGRSTSVRHVDTRLARFSKSANADFAEGHLENALDGYRKAMHRAWAMDDPDESGTAAYNVAACYVSLSRLDLAKDWLLDARAAMCRARVTAANAWILESKIAQREHRYDDAKRYLQMASCAGPDCDPSRGWCMCGPRDPCGESCLANIPCVGERIADRKAVRQCKSDFQSQIELGHARLAAEQYDVALATEHFQRACQLAGGPCNHDLHSELQSVAAHIHLSRGEFLKAASHFDNEVHHLRAAGNYREMPGSLRMAAAAYQQAGHFSLAASRMNRVARILLGRGDVSASWEALQSASELALSDFNESVSIRLALTAQEISDALSKRKGGINTADGTDAPSLGMVQADAERLNDVDAEETTHQRQSSAELNRPTLRPSM